MVGHIRGQKTTNADMPGLVLDTTICKNADHFLSDNLYLLVMYSAGGTDQTSAAINLATTGNKGSCLLCIKHTYLDRKRDTKNKKNLDALK
jgi:hypothetical protein